MKNSFYILNQLVNNLTGLNGIVAYSVFQMPYDDKKRETLYKTIPLQIESKSDSINHQNFSTLFPPSNPTQQRLCCLSLPPPFLHSLTKKKLKL